MGSSEINGKSYEHYFMTGVFFESDFPCSEYTCVTD